VVSEKKTKMSKFMDDNVNYDDKRWRTSDDNTNRNYSAILATLQTTSYALGV
jgi:hypothetical protein